MFPFPADVPVVRACSHQDGGGAGGATAQEQLGGPGVQTPPVRGAAAGQQDTAHRHRSALQVPAHVLHGVHGRRALGAGADRGLENHWRHQRCCTRRYAMYAHYLL